MTVPLYSYDHAFQGYIPSRIALQMEADGLAQLVREKRGKRKIRRVVMHRRAGEPHATTLRDYMGKAYSWEQRLDDGHQPWALRPLAGRVASGDASHEYHLAPTSLRPIFVRVLLDCLVTGAQAAA